MYENISNRLCRIRGSKPCREPEEYPGWEEQDQTGSSPLMTSMNMIDITLWRTGSVVRQDCDFVFNLAGVNRPKDPKEFKEGNFGFASTLLDTLNKHGNKCPVMLSSPPGNSGRTVRNV